MHRIKCAEVWGGSQAIDTDVCTNGLTASLFSTTSDGDNKSGGDIYYLSVCTHDVLTRICLADVVGHGAAINHISRWLYDVLVERIEDVEGNGVLADMNKLIHERGLEAMTTAAVITFYSENSGLSFSYAGHPPLLLRRKNKPDWQIMGVTPTKNPSDLPLGVLENTFYNQAETRLASGDRLLLYTDGVTEMMNEENELFGIVRLLKVLEQTDDSSLAEIKKAIRRAALDHAGSNLLQDDFTLIAIEVN